MTLVHQTEKVENKEEEMSTLIRFHQCYICLRVLRHDYRTIYNHLQVHKTDIDSYTKKYLKEIKEELGEKGMEYVLEKEEELKNSLTLEEYFRRRKAEEDGSESSADRLLREWFDYCEYKCGLCQEVCFSNTKFHAHIVRQHKLKNMKVYRERFGDPETTQRLHQCQLCGNNVKWEASRIRDHLKGRHMQAGKQLTLKEYGDKFKEKILSDLSRLANSDTSSENPPMRFGQSLLGGSKQDYTREEWKELFERKSLRGEKVSCTHCNLTLNRSSLYKHMQRSHPFEIENELREGARQAVRRGDGDKEEEDAEVEAEVEASLEETNLVETNPEETNLEGTVLEEVVSAEDLTPKFMIDHDSGEIMLLDPTGYTVLTEQSHPKNGNLSFVICSEDGGREANPISFVKAVYEETASTEETAKKDEVRISEVGSESEQGSDDEFETGPLDGQIVEIHSVDALDFVDYEDESAEDQTNKDPNVGNKEPGVELNEVGILEETCDRRGGSVDEDESGDDEIIHQTVYVEESNDGTFTIEEEQEVVEKEGEEKGEKAETKEEIKQEANQLSADKSLESIILSNVEGLQQIAIVRRKGEEHQRFDQKLLLEHLSSILSSDHQIFTNKNGPLKILEIEVDSQPADRGERTENKRGSKVAAAYARKEISNLSRQTNGRISVGTQASKWTKMAGERNKVARHKIVKPKVGSQGEVAEVGGEKEERISRPEILVGFNTSLCSRGTQVQGDPLNLCLLVILTYLS